MENMPGNFTVYLAVLAFVVGLGEFLLINTNRTLRRWGRALKVTAPLMVGYVAVLASIVFDPTESYGKRPVWYWRCHHRMVQEISFVDVPHLRRTRLRPAG
jgi:hypothetical protein